MNTNKITDLHIQISKEDLKILDLLLKANEYSNIVLYSCYCEKCYKEWYKVAINHKEDREIEKDVYENIKSKITNIYF
ncbi:hypothetical protein F7U24_08485 [Campylobacter jejuni]|nr:hypothetical protein [Campylobacter jejuni]EAJ0427882.1 hypothetical protein [Campylobacter jejuni]ECZ1765387.1 hypothetical protein [Campylobacter jejuni]EDO9878441.1 hypothetical protein [Campylobacter jejuni]EGT1081757.1 hypothetical protein [Campylobacter jejuni]